MYMYMYLCTFTFYISNYIYARKLHCILCCVYVNYVLGWVKFDRAENKIKTKTQTLM